MKYSMDFFSANKSQFYNSNFMGTPWDFTKTLWNLMESPWSLNYKNGTYLQKKIHRVFHMESHFPHGNSTVYETGTAVLQDRPGSYFRQATCIKCGNHVAGVRMQDRN